ncbi:unnamed protein product [Caenorhabditis bovis]|uniref:Uncharacterized protein n=1 Tax=Caenorhabditis bovis TaxID=2654633 RepID=A0A8S1F3L1_9PELO|nr:unnamed protein product [Caenorhabditis bovis]
MTRMRSSLLKVLLIFQAIILCMALPIMIKSHDNGANRIKRAFDRFDYSGVFQFGSPNQNDQKDTNNVLVVELEKPIPTTTSAPISTTQEIAYVLPTFPFTDEPIQEPDSRYMYLFKRRLYTYEPYNFN